MKLKQHQYDPVVIAKLINDHLGDEFIRGTDVHDLAATVGTKRFYTADNTRSVTLHSNRLMSPKGRPFVKVTLNRYNAVTGAKLSPHFHQFT